MFSRTRNRSSSGDKVICYGDNEQSRSINSAPSHVLDPKEIKSGSPLPRKSFPKLDNEPSGTENMFIKQFPINQNRSLTSV